MKNLEIFYTYFTNTDGIVQWQILACDEKRLHWQGIGFILEFKYILC